ncbi:unnamed protein product [Owenia fusiformis]|nr:unnamed protein product [Owenia fusiformis]
MPSKDNESKFLIHAYTFTGIDDDERSRHWQRPVNIIMMYAINDCFIQAKKKTTTVYTAAVITKKGKPLKKDTSKVEEDDPRFFMLHKTHDDAISLESFLSQQYYLASEYNGREGDPRPQLYHLPCDSHRNSNNYGAKFDFISMNESAEEYAKHLKEQYIRQGRRQT